MGPDPFRNDPCPSVPERGNHDTNVSWLVPDAASAPSERAGGRRKIPDRGRGWESAAVFNQRLLG